MDLIPLNNSGQGLIPDVNRDLAIKWLHRLYSEGALSSVEAWAQTDVTRKRLTQFLGAEEGELAFFPTTASALSQAALSLPLNSGDEILTWDQEYPSNFYPWRLACERANAKLIQVESEYYSTPAKRLLERVTKKTKAIAISWVQYQTGSVTDLKYLSDQLKGSGIWLIADVIQGVGVRPFHFHETGFDIVCGGGHKFLCSSYGAGYMVTRKGKIPELAPIEVGAMTFGTPETKTSFSIQPKTDSRKFEPGSKAMLEVIAMGATLDLFSKVGIQGIYEESTRLAEKLIQGLKNLHYEVIAENGPILNFHSNKSEKTDEALKKLHQEKVSCVKRGPGIRLSTHAYNTDAQIDRVLNLLNF